MKENGGISVFIVHVFAALSSIYKPLFIEAGTFFETKERTKRLKPIWEYYRKALKCLRES